MRVGNNYSGARWAFSQRGPVDGWYKYSPGHYVKDDWHACKLIGGDWGLDTEFPLGTRMQTFDTLKEAKAHVASLNGKASRGA